jgi:hypothetical protein
VKQGWHDECLFCGESCCGFFRPPTSDESFNKYMSKVHTHHTILP